MFKMEMKQRIVALFMLFLLLVSRAAGSAQAYDFTVRLYENGYCITNYDGGSSGGGAGGGGGGSW